MTIPEVVEDVTDIILNLKEVLLQMRGERAEDAPIDKEGQGGQGRRHHRRRQVEVLNPDHHIAHPQRGRQGPHGADGRAAAAATSRPSEQGRRPCRSAPSRSTRCSRPIRKVNYTVTNARVGQQTDYDKLTLEVWTNGSVAPGRRGGLRGQDPEGAAHDLHQLRGGRGARRAGEPVEERRSSTRTCSARSTSSSSRSARPTACRTPTSSTSASWCRRPRPRCSRPRTSAASR